MRRFWWSIYSLLLLYSVVILLRINPVQSQCSSSQFQCGNGRCIPALWKCDEDNDCSDFTDEQNCPSRTCSDTEFTCNNHKCIPSRWQCDNDNDCGDNSDENETCSNRTCKENQFPCQSTRICIPEAWKCDEQEDCTDGSDELNCGIITCTSEEFHCLNGKCITKRWTCDQDNDCGDKSDEIGCPVPTCSNKDFKCSNDRCIPEKWACDGDVDCNDGSDENNCTQLVSTSHCTAREFECANKRDCIHMSWSCDGDKDCADGSDEIDCHSTCRPDQFMCRNQQCIPGTLQCDQNIDCLDRSDESDCVNTPKPCDQKTEFDCGGGHCIPNSKVCDNINDCLDNSDEPANKCFIDECKINNGSCLQKCIDTPAGYYCDCHPGFKLVGNNSCDDVDECQTPGSCSQICENTKGSFKCSCFDGYQIDPKRPHFCKVIGREPSLIFANRHDIREILPGSSHLRAVVSELRSAIALDYIYEDGLVIWSDVAQERILSASMDRAVLPHTVIIKDNMNTPDGLAVDWIYRHIYWTDTGKNSIEVADLDGKFRKMLISTDLDEPRAIVVDPRFGWMYWTDWGQPAKIEKAGLDGTHRKAIITTEIQWPNGLAIDYVLNRLYWVDAKLHIIASSDFEGSKRQTILSSTINLKHPFSVSVFEDTVYWTDWETESIHSTNKFNGVNVSDIALSLYSPMDIHVYHAMKQPTGNNFCGPEKGHCSHMCLPAPQISERSAKFSCACPHGMVLQDDRRTCENEVSSSTSESSPVSSSTTTTHKSNNNSRNSIGQKEEGQIYSNSSNKGLNPDDITTMSSLGNLTDADTEEQRESDSGKVAGIVIGIIGGLILLGGLIGFFIWRQCVRRNVKSMNFDNPVYRKTTEDQFSLEKNQYQPSRSYPSTLEPLTSQGTNDYV